MKNKKMTLIAGAGAGVLALGMIGGGTFALWSDFDSVEDNQLSAGTLTLDVTDPNSSAVTPISMGQLAPGENKVADLFVATRGSGSPALQNAQLSMVFDNYEDIDDGCSSNSEAVLEGDANSRAGDPVCGTEGEFGNEAFIQFAYKKASVAGACSGGGYSTSVLRQGRLDDVATRTLALGSLNPGEGMCIRIEGGLPGGGAGGDANQGIDFAGNAVSTNISQGDSATFDLVFTLQQVIPN